MASRRRRRWDDEFDPDESDDDDNVFDEEYAGAGAADDDSDDGVAVPLDELEHDSDDDSDDDLVTDEVLVPEHIQVNWTSQKPDLIPDFNTFMPAFPAGNDPEKINVENMEPIDFFLKCTGPLLDLIRRETEIGGLQNLGEKWDIDLTPELMYRFLSVLIYMSYCRKPRVDMYWSDSILKGDLFCKSVIPRRTFLKIINNLRCTAYDLSIAKGFSDKTSPLYDPLWKVRDGITVFLKTVRSFRQPLKLTAADERIARFHGRCAFKTKVKGKPCDTGLKWWLLVESETLIIVNAILHCNYVELEMEKTLGRNSGVIYELFACRNLGNEYSLLNQGYEFHCDRLFSSPHLFLELEGHNTYGVGTCQDRTKHLPKAIVGKKTWIVQLLSKTTRRAPGQEIDTGTKNSGRGNMIFKYCGKKLVFCTWIDSKPVYLLSSLKHTFNEVVSCTRNAKVVKEGANQGKYEPKSVKQPALAHRYNSYMGAIDSIDFHLSSWRHFKGRKWSVMVILELLRFGVMDALGLLRERENKPTRHKFRMLDFQMELIRGLLGKANCIEVANLNLRNRSLLSLSAVTEAKRQAVTLHVGIYKGNSRDSASRKWCTCCKKNKTNHYCNTCQVYLCKPCFGVYIPHV